MFTVINIIPPTKCGMHNDSCIKNNGIIMPIDLIIIELNIESIVVIIISMDNDSKYSLF